MVLVFPVQCFTRALSLFSNFSSTGAFLPCDIDHSSCEQGLALSVSQNYQIPKY